MARQLTLIDYDLLSRITAKEWLAHNEWATNKAKKRDDESKPAAPNLVAMINHFNCVRQLPPPPRPAPNIVCRLARVVSYRVSCVLCVPCVSCVVCAGEQMGGHRDREVRQDQAQSPPHEEVHRSGPGASSTPVPLPQRQLCR